MAFFMLFILSIALLLFFIASVVALNDKSFWGPRLLNLGAIHLCLGWILLTIAAIEETRGNYLFDSSLYLIIMGSLLVIGAILATLGLFSSCARYKAAHQRSLAMEQLILALKNEDSHH